MIILIFGVSNVGKTTVGKIMADTLGISFYDLDDEIKRFYNITLEEFVHTGTIKERDAKRGSLIEHIIESNRDCVIAITPMSYAEYFCCFLKMENVLAIELRDSAENIFDRLVFSDENDNVYEDIEYKNLHREYYINEINEDLVWYGKVYNAIKNKYNVNNQLPEQVANQIINIYDL